MASKLFIKRLEISGFKSFPRRTVFSLDAGLTAVVGPNGCGKSNIIDAIRWVLGEQRASALRGARMEELIFHGSEREKPLGMAEVTLVLDNELGTLSGEGPEISITRRVYRSGESEYFLNKSAVRLKDITEAILDTGISTEAYVIMEQGKIDGVLESRPTERVELFEEAAGVMRYQMRKEETIRKLEATQQNLLRVGDIVHELRRQLDSLERQAKHAEQFQELRKRYQELRSRQRAVELVSGESEARTAEEGAENLRKALAEAREHLAGRQAALRQTREGLDREEAAVRETERGLTEMRESGLAQARQSEDLRLEIQMLLVQSREREHRGAETADDLKRIEERLARAGDAELAEAESLAAALTVAEDLAAKVTELESGLKARRDEAAVLRERLGDHAESLRTAPVPGGVMTLPEAHFMPEDVKARAVTLEYPLGALLDARDPYRNAVISALGSLSEAAVVDTWNEARAVLGAWRETCEGPLAIVVMESLGEAAPRGVLPEGTKYWADEVVSCAPKYAHLARVLLGSVAVMEGEEIGRVYDSPVAFESGVKVMRPGVVLWPGRIARQRIPASPEVAGMLAEVMKEISYQEVRVAEIESGLLEARRAEGEAKVAAARLEQKLDGRRRERGGLEQAKEDAAALLRRLVSELEGIKADHERQTQDLARRESMTWEQRGTHDEMVARLSQAHESVRQLRESAMGIERGIEETHGKLDTVQQDLVVMESRYHEAKARFDVVQEEFAREFATENVSVEDLAKQSLSPEETAELARLDTRLADMGQVVNLSALEEFQGLSARYEEYQAQIEDLRRSRESLQRAIVRLDRQSEARFEMAFNQIRANFHLMFRRLFGGGDGDLELIEDENEQRGVEIVARPPGKRAQSIALLSGGERALVSTALLLALFMTKPSPFCLMDEIEAPLDDANIDRFLKIIREFNEATQFILITHNKHTMEMVDSLYGITIEEPGVSKIVSVRLKGAQPAKA